MLSPDPSCPPARLTRGAARLGGPGGGTSTSPRVPAAAGQQRPSPSHGPARCWGPRAPLAHAQPGPVRPRDAVRLPSPHKACGHLSERKESQRFAVSRRALWVPCHGPPGAGWVAFVLQSALSWRKRHPRGTQARVASEALSTRARFTQALGSRLLLAVRAPRRTFGRPSPRGRYGSSQHLAVSPVDPHGSTCALHSRRHVTDMQVAPRFREMEGHSTSF